MGVFDDLIPPSAASQTSPQSAGSATPAGQLSQGVGGAFEYPEGATIDQINAINAAYSKSPQRQIDQGQFRASQAAQNKKAFRELPGVARFGLAAGSSVEKMAMGAGQMLGLSGDQDEIARRERASVLEGDTAASAGKIAGDIALAAIPVSRVSSLGRLGQYALGGATGAAFGALQPVAGEESRGVNTAIGGALGLAGQGLADVVGSFGRRAAQAATPELKALYQQAKSRGIQLTPAQLTDSQFVKRLSLMLDRMPLSGAPGRSQAQMQAINQGVAKAIGQQADTVDQRVMGNAYDQLGQQYDNLFAGGMKYDREFLKDIAHIRRDAAQQMDDAAIKTVNTIARRIKKQGDAGDLKGKTLQSIDRVARMAVESGSPDRVGIGGRVRDAIRENIERTAGPQVRSYIQDLNRKYRAYKTIEPLVAGAPEGGISPTALLGAVNSTKRGRAAMARGQAGELGELALLGQRMRGPTTSGTAENAQAGALAGGLLSAPLRTLGLLAGAPVASRALNSGLLSDYLMSSGRGQGAQLLAPYLQNAGLPAIGILAETQAQRPKNPRKRP